MCYQTVYHLALTSLICMWLIHPGYKPGVVVATSSGSSNFHRNPLKMASLIEAVAEKSISNWDLGQP